MAARRDATYDEVMQERREAEYAARKSGRKDLSASIDEQSCENEPTEETKKPFALLVLAAMGPGVVSAMA